MEKWKNGLSWLHPPLFCFFQSQRSIRGEKLNTAKLMIVTFSSSFLSTTLCSLYHPGPLIPLTKESISSHWSQWAGRLRAYSSNWTSWSSGTITFPYLAWCSANRIFKEATISASHGLSHMIWQNLSSKSWYNAVAPTTAFALSAWVIAGYNVSVLISSIFDSYFFSLFLGVIFLGLWGVPNKCQHCQFHDFVTHFFAASLLSTTGSRLGSLVKRFDFRVDFWTSTGTCMSNCIFFQILGLIPNDFFCPVLLPPVAVSVSATV